ncbi:hypothetical protein SASPL_129170 [Salvia splendens]|uniref:3-oxoacyl-[acyl-carrier protein] reductase n=1 Tax=Salvia splendens TaxID=180675 RepID=A0A8X8XCA8_SALSN|nr:hypothetical protein SASPL_129170 [Salvia splendens]
MERRSQVERELEPWLRLENKVVMVTGASSGLGREFGLDLAKAGCRVIAAARRMDRLQSLCHEINSGSPEANHPRAVAVELDISASGSAVEASVQKAWDAFGRIDALINNAGIRGNVKSSLDISEEEFNNVVKTNLIGSWLVSKCVGARLRAAGCSGTIINISSGSGLGRAEQVGSVAYTSSKAGLNHMIRVMAL